MAPVSNPKIDDRIGQALRNWADAGALPPERSFELERLVYRISHQGQHSRLFSVLRGALAALAAYITMLFFACPAAGSILPAAEFLVEKGAMPATVLVEQLAYNPVAPIFNTSSNMKGAQS